MSTRTSTDKPAASRQSVMTMALRNPRVIAAPSTRLVVTGLIAIGALISAASGGIHLYLYGGQYGYRYFTTIGALFLAQGVVAILLALLVLGTRWLAAVVATAGFLIATAVGLVLSIYVGLFNFTDSWSAPLAIESFVIELIGGTLLLVAGLFLLRPGRSRA